MNLKKVCKATVGAAGLFTGYCAGEAFSRLGDAPKTFQSISRETGEVMAEYIAKVPLISEIATKIAHKRYIDNIHHTHISPVAKKHSVNVYAALVDILDIFEDLLDIKDIGIPCDDEGEEFDRTQNGNTARIYGMEYVILGDDIREVLNKLLEAQTNGTGRYSHEGRWVDKNGVSHTTPTCPEEDCCRKQVYGCSGCNFEAARTTEPGKKNILKNCIYPSCPGKSCCVHSAAHGCKNCKHVPGGCAGCDNLEKADVKCFDCSQIPDYVDPRNETKSNSGE